MIGGINYGYDTSGNRTWRKNLAATDGGQDRAYRTKGIYQIKEPAQGTLNFNQSAIETIPGEEKAFAYHSSGTWTDYTQKAECAVTLDQVQGHQHHQPDDPDRRIPRRGAYRRPCASFFRFRLIIHRE